MTTEIPFTFRVTGDATRDVLYGGINIGRIVYVPQKRAWVAMNKNGEQKPYYGDNARQEAAEWLKSVYGESGVETTDIVGQ